MHTFPHGRRLAVVTFALVLVATIAPLSLLATPALPPPVPLAIKPPPDGYFELPFWVVPGGARQVNVTTSWSYSCYTFQNPLTDTIKLTDAQCTATLLDYSHRNNADAMEWGRNYNGIFTQHVIEALGGPRLIALNHGENKNENIEGECGQGGTCFQNTINQDVHCASCASGYCGGGYSDCWDAYNSLVNLSWQDFDAEHDYGMQLHHDEGPIVWPANGYTYGGQKSSWGVRHPHGIVDGDYIWVFYLDSSKGAGNRGFGIKVARAPITSGGLPGNWQSYCAGQWVASLPPGFSRDQIQDFYPQRGGCASPILPEGMNYISFAVAKLTDGGYLGVDEHLDEHGQWKWQAGLWASTNLVTWQQIGVVEQNTSGYAAGVLHYPVFLSENGWHSDAVTLADFYVLGAQAGVVHALHMSLTPAPTPTRTPTPPPTATRTPTPTPTVTPPPLTPQARLPYLQR